MPVGITINVALMGFNGDGGYGYTLEEESLERLLNDALPVYRPSSMEDKKLLDVEYQIIYNVVKLPTDNLKQLTEKLGAEMSAIDRVYLLFIICPHSFLHNPASFLHCHVPSYYSTCHKCPATPDHKLSFIIIQHLTHDFYHSNIQLIHFVQIQPLTHALCTIPIFQQLGQNKHAESYSIGVNTPEWQKFFDTIHNAAFQPPEDQAPFVCILHLTYLSTFHKIIIVLKRKECIPIFLSITNRESIL